MTAKTLIQKLANIIDNFGEDFEVKYANRWDDLSDIKWVSIGEDIGEEDKVKDRWITLT